MSSQVDFLEHKLCDLYEEIERFSNVPIHATLIERFYAFVNRFLLKIEYHQYYQLLQSMI